MRERLGRLLRRWADRLDPTHAPRKSGYSYTVERGSSKYPGIAVHTNGTGCPFWIMSQADRDRAYTEAATDWRSPNEKLTDMLHQFGRNLEDAVRPAADTLATYWTDSRQQGSRPLHKPEKDQ